MTWVGKGMRKRTSCVLRIERERFVKEQTPFAEQTLLCLGKSQCKLRAVARYRGDGHATCTQLLRGSARRGDTTVGHRNRVAKSGWVRTHAESCAMPRADEAVVAYGTPKALG